VQSTAREPKETGMPSPFPGMDPYLERPDRWGGVHARLIAVLGEILTRQVAPRFFVDSEDTVYILAKGDPARAFIRPDLALVDASSGAHNGSASSRISAPTLVAIPEFLEVRLPHLTIIDSQDRRVVTTIEVLSPINKARDSSGQRDFLRKRRQVFSSHTHWLEIDLLRAGLRAPDIPLNGDYYAALHRAGSTKGLEAWFCGLPSRLPTVAVPLVEPLEDVPLDLQEAVDTVYERYRYDTGIDYADDPPPPSLHHAIIGWARDRVAPWREGQAPT
jgi:Protein of unknown function (DUF4058)